MAMEKAATAQGEAGAGLGMGMGMMLPGLFAGGRMQAAQTGGEPVSVPMIQCPDCASDISADARFCPLCGHQQVQLVRCHNCGKNLTPKAKFCSQCGEATDRKPQPKRCSACNAENLPDSMFCNECGVRLPASGLK
jgi:rRNA maturation endonuclease Nob1